MIYNDTNEGRLKSLNTRRFEHCDDDIAALLRGASAKTTQIGLCKRPDCGWKHPLQLDDKPLSINMILNDYFEEQAQKQRKLGYVSGLIAGGNIRFFW